MYVLLRPHQNVLPLPFHLISSFSSFRSQRSLSFLPSSFLPFFSLFSFLPSAHSFSLSLNPSFLSSLSFFEKLCLPDPIHPV